MTGTAAIKVLVVDDYEAMRMLIHRCLTRQGIANVRLKPDAEEALAALRDERFDLIISDYKLGGLDGLGLLKRVRENPATRDTRFILLTGADDRAVLREAMALGADEYMTKPFEPRSLRATIERLFGMERGEAEDRGPPVFRSLRAVPAVGADWLPA